MTPLLDANIIIRYLTGDHADHSPRATKLLDQAAKTGDTFKVLPHILCEIVYVLEGKLYNFSRHEVCDRLLKVCELPCIEFDFADEMRTALIWHKRHSVDFADALLAAVAGSHSAPIYTFNTKHFDRLQCDAVPPPPLVDDPSPEAND